MSDETVTRAEASAQSVPAAASGASVLASDVKNIEADLAAKDAEIEQVKSELAQVKSELARKTAEHEQFRIDQAKAVADLVDQHNAFLSNFTALKQKAQVLVGLIDHEPKGQALAYAYQDLKDHLAALEGRDPNAVDATRASGNKF